MVHTRSLVRLMGAAALVACFAMTAYAQSELTPEAAAKRVAERYGVEVLRVAEAEHDGHPVYVVTVMNPGGDYNAAFQVNRLMVDRMTGDLVSQVHHGPTGYATPGTGGVTGGINGEAVRRMTLPEASAQGGG